MPLTIDATAGGSSANSYCTLAEARAYYDSNYRATADDLFDDTILTQLLVTATSLLDERFDWVGTVTSQSQSLLWPRVGAVGLNGYSLASNAVPAKVKDATAEFARQLLATDLTADNDLQTQDIQYLTVGSIQMKFGTPGSKVVPDAVFSKVKHLGRVRSEGGYGTAFRV